MSSLVDILGVQVSSLLVWLVNKLFIVIVCDVRFNQLFYPHEGSKSIYVQPLRFVLT